MYNSLATFQDKLGQIFSDILIKLLYLFQVAVQNPVYVWPAYFAPAHQ